MQSIDSIGELHKNVPIFVNTNAAQPFVFEGSPSPTPLSPLLIYRSMPGGELEGIKRMSSPRSYTTCAGVPWLSTGFITLYPLARFDGDTLCGKKK